MPNKSAIVYLFLANALLGMAQGIAMISVPWHFARIGASETFNFYYALITFAMLFWGLFAGSLVDRYPRKLVFLVRNITEGLLIFIIGTIGLVEGGLPSYAILSVFMITMLGYQVHFPNLYAFAQQLVAPEDYSRINSYIEVVGQSALATAGFLGALLLEGFERSMFLQLGSWSFHWTLYVPKLGIEQIFFIDGCAYLLAVIFIIQIRYRPFQVPQIERGPVLRRIKTGFGYLRSNRLLLIFGLSSFSVFISMLVILYGILPMYITNYLASDAQIFGLYRMTMAFGSVISGLLVRQALKYLSIPTAILWAMGIVLISLCFLFFSKAEWILLLAGFVMGFANSSTRIMRLTYILERVPNALVGRVNSVFSMFNVLLRTLLISLLALPFFAIGDNVRYAILLMFGFLLVAFLVMLLYARRFLHYRPANKS
ncbi:MAG: MFS transporter [Bernardetiaceae bacterium]|nr:MFS transporter [Bernardetiaceae bacterium]